MSKLGQMEALDIIYRCIRKEDLVVGNMNMSTWCMQPIVRKDFPLGSQPNNLLFGIDMGFCTATACGLALALPHRKVISIDGDGAILMKLAVLADVAQANPSNLVIVVLDNESYGGRPKEPTCTATVADLAAIARGSGIRNVKSVNTAVDLEREFERSLEEKELTFIWAKVQLKAEEISMAFDERYWVDVEWKNAFIRNIEKTEGIQLITKTVIEHYKP